jgi:hypothetical protein
LSSASSPPRQPPPSPVDPNIRRRQLAKLYWFRVGLGALAGFLSGLFGFLTLNPSEPNPNAYNGALVAIGIYIISYYIAKYALNLNLPEADKNKLVTQGIGGYTLIFLFVWFLYNTLCLAPGFHCLHF